jgi:hypothetical protein
MPERRERNTPPGPGVDASGQAVIDPTKNVLDLVRAETKRQDDLREADSRHTREIIALHAQHEADLRKAEAKRLNAIRSVDVQAVASAASVQLSQAEAIAKQVSDTAEAARQAMAAAATANATSLRAEIAPLQKDIADLRQSQYEGVGAKTQVTEGQARSGTVGLWVGVGVAALFGLLSLLFSAAGLVVVLTK